MSALSIPASIYNKFDGYLFEFIRDYAYGTPKDRYNKIIKQIGVLNDIPVCGEKCKFQPKLSGGTLKKYPVQIESTGYKCRRRISENGMECGKPVDSITYKRGIDFCAYCNNKDFWSNLYYHHDCGEEETIDFPILRRN